MNGILQRPSTKDVARASALPGGEVHGVGVVGGPATGFGRIEQPGKAQGSKVHAAAGRGIGTEGLTRHLGDAVHGLGLKRSVIVRGVGQGAVRRRPKGGDGRRPDDLGAESTSLGRRNTGCHGLQHVAQAGHVELPAMVRARLTAGAEQRREVEDDVRTLCRDQIVDGGILSDVENAPPALPRLAGAAGGRSSGGCGACRWGLDPPGANGAQKQEAEVLDRCRSGPRPR